MGKTHTDRIKKRNERLSAFHGKERSLKTATIKQKEKRILDAGEKHALKMNSELGKIMNLWESLRLSNSSIIKNNQLDCEKDLDSKAACATGNHHSLKTPIIDELLGILIPKFDLYAKMPRVSRVFQSMIKYGSPDQLDHIFKSLSSQFSVYCQDHFAHFVVLSLIRHAPHSLHQTITQNLISCAPNLITHSYGLQVINAVYTSRLSNTHEKHLLSLASLKENIALMKHWLGFPVLNDILDLEVSQQSRLIPRLFQVVDCLISQKKMIELPYVHHLLYCTLVSGISSDIQELCVSVKPHLASILCFTNYGSLSASLTFSILPPKDRKKVLSEIGKDPISIATNKYGAPFLAHVIDIVYDSQVLYKYITQHFEGEIDTLLGNPYGFRIIIHMLTPDDERKWRLLPESWRQYRLYSLSSSTWNTHTWRTSNFEKETIQVASKDPLLAYMPLLQNLIPKLLDFLKLHTVSGVIDLKTKDSRRFHAALIVKELLNCLDCHDSYKNALSFLESELPLLKKWISKDSQTALQGLEKIEKDATNNDAKVKKPEKRLIETTDIKSRMRKKIKSTTV